MASLMLLFIACKFTNVGPLIKKNPTPYKNIAQLVIEQPTLHGKHLNRDETGKNSYRH